MAKKVFLEFEHDIEALEKKIDDLRELDESEAGHAVSVASEIASLQAKEDELVKKIYAELTPWQCSLVARHPQRPYTLDYIAAIFTDSTETALLPMMKRSLAVWPVWPTSTLW